MGHGLSTFTQFTKFFCIHGVTCSRSSPSANLSASSKASSVNTSQSNPLGHVRRGNMLLAYGQLLVAHCLCRATTSEQSSGDINGQSAVIRTIRLACVSCAAFT